MLSPIMYTGSELTSSLAPHARGTCREQASCILLLVRPPAIAETALSVAASLSLPQLLDLLGFPFINLGERVTCVLVCMQQFIELGVDRLRIAVLRSLDQQGHEPRGHRRNAVPIETFTIEQEPEHGVGRENRERH